MCFPKRNENANPLRFVYTCHHSSTLFIIASNWKQSNSSPIIESSPTIHEWVNKMWYIQTMEQHSDIERNELLIHGTIWMNLKIIMPNENMSTQMTDDIPYVSNNMKF